MFALRWKNKLNELFWLIFGSDSWSLIKSFLEPNSDCSQIPNNLVFRSVVCSMYTHLVFTVNMLHSLWHIKSNLKLTINKFTITIDCKCFLISYSLEGKVNLSWLTDVIFCERSCYCDVDIVIICSCLFGCDFLGISNFFISLRWSYLGWWDWVW